MHSKPLRQMIDLELDAAGMRGPVKRRDIAEAVLVKSQPSHWALADERDARMSYLQNAVAQAMNEPLGDEFVQQYLPSIPGQYHAALSKIPRFICVNARGGREAEHVLSLNASREQWEATLQLRRNVAEWTRLKTTPIQEIVDLLVALAADTLMDITKEEAA